MKEATLRDFFVGASSTKVLRDDLVDALVRTSAVVTKHPIVDMKEDFQVSPEHLVRICDAFVKNELSADDLRAIGFCLVASSRFVWDGSDPLGERVANVASDWSAPEINYPITASNVEKWREYLVTGVNALAKTAV